MKNEGELWGLQPLDRGFMSRAFLLCALPHSKPPNMYVTVSRGNIHMQISGNVWAGGVPYGSLPRLMLAWLSTEVIRTKEQRLNLGRSLYEFTFKLGITVGGKQAALLQKQLLRLLLCSCLILTTVPGEELDFVNFPFVDNGKLWVMSKDGEKQFHWGGEISLSKHVFDEMISHPVPIDLNALRALRHSPLAIDIYTWLTYRMSYLSSCPILSWETLHEQFGSEYARDRAFKAKFLPQLKSVLQIYSQAKVDILDTGLRLKPSRPHVGRIR